MQRELKFRFSSLNISNMPIGGLFLLNCEIEKLEKNFYKNPKILTIFENMMLFDVFMKITCAYQYIGNVFT
jgi:hypothetical protein